MNEMCDRISQLQDNISQLADTMCNAIGLLQQGAPPSALSTLGSTKMLSNYTKQNSGEVRSDEYPVLFAQLITKSARDVDFLIDHLPPDDANLEQQVNMIKKLDSQSKEAASHLLSLAKSGEDLMEKIQRALEDVAQCEIEIGKLDI